MIITGYQNVYLDGVAYSFAYAELLRKKGQDAVPVVFGTPHMEEDFVMDYFDIPKIKVLLEGEYIG